MKRNFLLWAIVLLCPWTMWAQSDSVIRIGTQRTDLVLRVTPEGKLAQAYLGPRLLNASDCQQIPAGVGREVYFAYGSNDYFEPAIRVTHADGHPGMQLDYVSQEVVPQSDPNVQLTVVTLRDKVYPLEVKLFYETYDRENVIKMWTEIRHDEKKAVVLHEEASAMLYMSSPAYYLTEFTGSWGDESIMREQRLLPGKKVLDTRLGARAAMFCSPFFLLSVGDRARENDGQVLLGTLNWTGNFRFTFELDSRHVLRLIAGINPYASEYRLEPGQVFRTPEFVWTLSETGTGQASRDLQDWARNYQLKDGHGDRLTLLNNWESTGFNFDEEVLKTYIRKSADLGVDMFLLDDGWFANKYPRKNDKQGLGDWEPTHDKLPGGVQALVEEADRAGVKFGIWIEPEMVSMKSELYEKHPDWVIRFPDREPYFYRNQLVLDLCNPEVQDYVFGIVDKLLSENPKLAYFKWDCNSPITNPLSPYLKENQSHLYIDYVRGLYNVLDRIKAKYPNVPMMLCSGGSGRCDYGALQYFTEFWASDNTDPIRRIFIQWGFSHFFPAKSVGAHVTSMGKQSLKFRTDVALTGKLGFDIDVNKLTPEEIAFCRQAVGHFKRLSPVTLEGDQYRLVSPYEGQHAALMYVAKDQDKAVLFTYDLFPNRYTEKVFPVRLQGLDPHKMYKVEEINQEAGVEVVPWEGDGEVFSGDYLMKVGLNLFTDRRENSRMIELTAQ